MSEASSPSAELIRKVLAELQRRFRLAGRGTVGRVERQLKLGAGYFKDQRRAGRQRFDLKILFRALDALGVEPAEFFASVLGSADPVASFQAEAAVLRRAKSLPRILDLEAERSRHGTGRPAPGRPAPGRPVPGRPDPGRPDPGRPDPEKQDGGGPDPEETASELEVLDGLRHQSPGLVMRRTRAMIGWIADSQVPLLLGVHATAARVAGYPEAAHIVLARALDLAAERHDDDVRGDLLLRAADVMGTRGEIETAHALTERASLTFAKSGNLVGIGRSLIDQGTWLSSLDRPRRALRALSVALEYFPAAAPGSRSGEPRSGEPRSGVPEEEPDPLIQRSRFTCLMSLGLTYRRQGDLETARRYLEQARRHTRGVARDLVGRLLALQASIARQSGRHQEAEDLFRQAFEVFRPIDPLDAALCGVELARVQLQQKKAPEAHQTVTAMLPLLEPLEKNPLASAAVAELVRGALMGPPQVGPPQAGPRQAGPRQAGPRQAGPRQAEQGLSLALLRRVARGLEAGRDRQA